MNVQFNKLCFILNKILSDFPFKLSRNRLVIQLDFIHFYKKNLFFLPQKSLFLSLSKPNRVGFIFENAPKKLQQNPSDFTFKHSKFQSHNQLWFLTSAEKTFLFLTPKTKIQFSFSAQQIGRAFKF
jgi:hypothetical protein